MVGAQETRYARQLLGTRQHLQLSLNTRIASTLVIFLKFHQTERE
jgi:hypothetical protein